MNNASIGHSIWRSVVALASFGVPLVFTTFPMWQSLTLGAVAYAALHYAQSKAGI